MSDADLRRMRDDLDSVRQAAGIDLPFAREDVWHTLALAPAGVFLSIWAYFGLGDSLVIGLIPLLLVAGGVGARQLWKRFRTGAGASARRERSFSTISVLVIVAGLAVYFLWNRQFGLVNGPPGVVAVYFLGVLCLLLGLSGRSRRVHLAGAATLIPFGLVAPLCTSQQAVAAAGGVFTTVAGLLAAAIMAGQLRDRRRDHEPVPH